MCMVKKSLGRLPSLHNSLLKKENIGRGCGSKNRKHEIAYFYKGLQDEAEGLKYTVSRTDNYLSFFLGRQS